MTDNDITDPSPGALDFDPAGLQRFLEGHVGQTASPFACVPVGGGQSNPTYFVDFAGRQMVLRKRPAGPILRGAHAIDREFRVLTALARTAVPVPRPILYHENAGIVGTAFYLMERLFGRVFHDCSLPGLAPAERRAIYFAMADALARLHALRPEEVGLADFGSPGNYFERQIARWSRQWKESPSERIAALDDLVQWLPRNLPADDGRIAIAHGDYRLGNLIFHPQRSEVIGILDWELSTLGHPLADLGFCCLPWNSTPDEYGGIRGLDHAKLGIPSQGAFVERYFSGAVPTSPLQRFHIVFALFRFAVIFVGIADRARSGSAASANAAALAPLARRFAERALEIIEGG
ncbi:MAG TPA: phosphotransferase family protein [Nordella sp.]|nr:phosphotransferase family protein [Nordella sp.]